MALEAQVTALSRITMAWW